MNGRHKHKQYSLRIPQSLKDYFTDRAERNDRSLNAEIISCLLEKMQEKKLAAALKEPLAVKLDMVNTAKDVFGEAAAKELWITLGLSAFDNENNPTTEESPSKK